MKNIKFYILVENLLVLNKTIDCMKLLNHDNIEINIVFHKSFKFIPKMTIIKNVFNLQYMLNKSQILNFCIIDAFKNPDNADTKIITIMTNNILLSDDYIEKINEYHTKFDLIQSEYGSNYISFTNNVIKTIGLFDEGYCNSDYMICDYYLNAKLHDINLSINDKLTDIHVDSLSDFCFQMQVENEVSHIYEKDYEYFKMKWGDKININKLQYLNTNYKKKYEFEKNLNIETKKIPKQELMNICQTKILCYGYAIKNLKSGLYISVENPSPSDIQCVKLSDKEFKFFIYQEKDMNKNNFWLIRIMELIKNQNDSIGWHLYTLPSDTKIYGSGNNGKWAYFQFQKDGSVYKIKTYHNILNCKENPGRYLWVENGILRNDGDASMEETSWMLE